MTNLIVIGAQWGDEGKGKIVDLLTAHFDVIVRSQGGHNAGHTVMINGQQFILHLVPSGILHPQKLCAIGNGVVIDLVALKKEITDLEAAGISCRGRLCISNRAHVILEYHRLAENNIHAAIYYQGGIFQDYLILLSGILPVSARIHML